MAFASDTGSDPTSAKQAKKTDQGEDSDIYKLVRILVERNLDPVRPQHAQMCAPQLRILRNLLRVTSMAHSRTQRRVGVAHASVRVPQARTSLRCHKALDGLASQPQCVWAATCRSSSSPSASASARSLLAI